ncbi:hypothetical protein [Methylobacterium sp. CM6257]
MARVRLHAFSRDLKVIVERTLSTQARQKLAADAGRRVLAEAQAQNARALGAIPPHETFVDGRPGAALESVNPDRGEILFRFNLATDVFAWIDEQLIIHSPVGDTPKSPEYNRSHIFFVDGEQSDPSGGVSGETFIYLNTVPYARKIERGLSKQTPDGVYEVVATLAARRFGNIASIKFGYRSFQAGALVYNPGKFDLRRGFREQGLSEAAAKAAASKIIKAERDTRQPAIIITIR